MWLLLLFWIRWQVLLLIIWQVRELIIRVV
jgi:hypothetical protein